MLQAIDILLTPGDIVDVIHKKSPQVFPQAFRGEDPSKNSADILLEINPWRTKHLAVRFSSNLLVGGPSEDQSFCHYKEYGTFSPSPFLLLSQFCLFI